MRTGGACSAIPKPGRREGYWIRARNTLPLLPTTHTSTGCFPTYHFGVFSAILVVRCFFRTPRLALDCTVAVKSFYILVWCFYYGLKSLAELAWFCFRVPILEFGSGRFCIWSLRFLPRSLRFRLVIDIRVPDTNIGIPVPSQGSRRTIDQEEIIVCSSGRNYCLQLEQNEIHDNSSIN